MCKKWNVHLTCPSLKRFFLPFLGIFALVIFDEIRNLYYFPLVFTFGFFVLFWNFPQLVYFTNLKPVYYEDLFVHDKQERDYYLTDKMKRKFDMIFEWTLIIMNALLMGVLADYWLYKIHGDLELLGEIQILGITGGILKLFQSVNTFLGQLMISIMQKFIRHEQIKYKEKLKKIKSSNGEIELAERKLANMRKTKSVEGFQKFYNMHKNRHTVIELTNMSEKK